MKRLGQMVLAAALAAVLLAAAALAAAWLVPLPERLHSPGSRVIEYADGSPMCVFLSPDDKWRAPVYLDEIDPLYLKALVAYEDKRFYYHLGVDPLALARAVRQNLSNREVVSGASTITMQLVRILEPRPRTIGSKIIEALRAAQLEARMDKEEILEAYLQFAPFGKNLDGVESAALAYFGHRAKNLSPLEVCYLLSVPQRPNDRYPSPENAAQAKEVIARISGLLEEKGVLDERQAARAREGEVPTELKPFPRDALHAAYFLYGGRGGDRVRSAIERDVQAAVEDALASYRTEYAGMGVHNASVVVIESRTGRVVAAAGNFDFYDSEHGGQNVGFNAPRSPGSTLKPFVYAMAIDRGLALPEYLVPDVPVRYAGYEPINYDHKFRGLVRLDDSLSQSLNVPFVNLTRDLGLESFIDFLKAGGIKGLKSEPGYYGLSISIGACDMTLAELTGLYAALDAGGEYRKLAWTMDETDSSPKRILSPGASYLTRAALTIRDRPDFPKRKRAGRPAGVFWKTGTSARHRDAWALGGNGKYAAGVWTGNFDGSPSRYLVGADRSGPILFDVLESLPAEKDGQRPPDLVQVKVCAFSGHLAGPSCPSVRKAWAVKSAVPRDYCPYHKTYEVDVETGYRVNPLCRGGARTENRTFTILPSNARGWIEEQSVAAYSPPPLAPYCRRAAARDDGPLIVSPRSEAVFLIIPGLKAERQEIPLEAVTGTGTGELYWFVDGRLHAAAPPTEKLWLSPEPGNHELRVMNEAGKSHSINFRVIAPG